RVLSLTRENPQTASALGMPADFQGTKNTIVAPYYEEHGGYQFSKTGECLMENAPEIATTTVALVGYVYPKVNLPKAIIAGSALVSEVGGCIKEGFDK
ncbi:MAG: hypothetical protein Q7T11_05730, partial [Deltaproteobacteria bacterium]|nr:hypothetical protein [Deltaproteobacteria bacterium]